MMINYMIKRVLYGLLVIVLVTLLVASIIYLAPVDPARLTFGQRSDAASVALKQKELGLNQPLHVQLLWYLNDISPVSWHQNKPNNLNRYQGVALTTSPGGWVCLLKKPYLRRSYQSGRLVSDLLAAAIPKTLLLATAAILLALFSGVALGVFAAVRKDRFFDRAAVVVSTLGYSIPSYVAAIFLALLFGFFLHDWTRLPVQGSLTVLAREGAHFGEERIVWKNLILPALALGVRPVAIITQLTRSAMLDVLSRDYIRAAYAKGLPKWRVLWQHALRNALNPVLTAATGWFAALLAGAFFVENVFAFKGLGSLTVEALLSFDIPVVLGAVLFTSVVFVIVNLLTDLLYVALNPGARLE